MEKISFIPEQFEQHDWVRISYCLHGSEFRQMVQEEWYPEQYGWSYLRVAPAERQTLREVWVPKGPKIPISRNRARD